MSILNNSVKQRIILEKITVAYLVKKFPLFVEYVGSLPCSQEPATGPYPEPDESSPHLHALFLEDLF
jgi:hypothetical protein